MEHEEIKVCICEPFLISGLLPTMAAPILKGALVAKGYSAQIMYPSLFFYVENRIDNNQLFLELVNDIPLQVYDLLFETDMSYASASSRFLEKKHIQMLRYLRSKAEECLINIVERIVELKPEILILSMTFGGYSFAKKLFDLVKKKLTNIKIVVGGSNCVPEMCSQLISEIPMIDYIICDESTESLVELTRFIVDKQGNVPNCVFFKGKDRTEYVTLSTMDNLPYPVFDDYLQCMMELGISKDMITLPFELARGCWWSEKEPCKMCGFFGKRKSYLIKSPKRIIEELTEIVKVYDVHKFRMTDLVQPPIFILEEIKKIKELNIKFFLEIRPDIRENDICILRDMGMSFAQVGIESLSTDALRCINKGTTGIHNIEVLIWSVTYKINLVWNYLYGMEHEEVKWYENVIKIMPFLYHLPPPFARKIWINKYSTWADEILKDTSLSFFLVNQRECDKRIKIIYEDFRRAIDKWQSAFKNGYALYIDHTDTRYLHLVRKYETEEHYYLLDNDRIIYEAIRTASTYHEIVLKTKLDDGIIKKSLEYFLEIGVAIFLDDKYLALATDDSKYKWVKGTQQTLRFTLDKSYYVKPELKGNMVLINPICGNNRENLFSLDQTVDYLKNEEKIFVGKEGAYIIVGGCDEIFLDDRNTRDIFFRWILKLIELENPIVIVTKKKLTEDEILMLHNNQKYENHIYLLESLQTLSNWEKIASEDNFEFV